ncbi:MAG: HEAT repeat domain-containing protein [Ignavibacteria bacterium]|nr:HEAT repeat domain-containing protein [Ignavibacteria bacterium]MDP3582416.1 HEAT repeat domain-containing protein [Ignavibacteria bacterium]
MKKLVKYFMIGIFVLLATSTVSKAQFYHVSEESIAHKIVHTNPMEGLKSENPLIRFDSAYMIGELKDSKADIALMKALREDEDQSVRIVSALSLIKIGSPVGVHLVKRISELSDCPKTCKILGKFYNSYARHKELPNKELSEFQIASMIFE